MTNKIRRRMHSNEPRPQTSGTGSRVRSRTEETPFEALASICSVLVVGTVHSHFLAQNFVIPSGSMENTLLVGDHLVVDRINLAPPAKWMPLVHYREPRRGDIVVFIKPSPEPEPGRRRQTAIFLSGQAPCRSARRPHPSARRHRDSQRRRAARSRTLNPRQPDNYQEFLDEFPSVPPYPQPGGATESWAVDFPNHVVDGDLVVPAGHVLHDGRQSA